MKEPANLGRLHYLKDIKKSDSPLHEYLYIEEWNRQRKIQFYQTLLIVSAINKADNVTEIYKKYEELVFPELEKQRMNFVETARLIMKKYDGKIFRMSMKGNTPTVTMEDEEKTDANSSKLGTTKV